MFYPSHLLLTVTDYSLFEILLAFLFSYSLCFWAPQPWKSKSQGRVAGGQVLLVQIYSFAFECSICIQMLSFIGIKRFSPRAPFVQRKIGLMKLLRKVGERSGLLPFSLWYYVYNLIICVWEEPKFNFPVLLIFKLFAARDCCWLSKACIQRQIV